MTSMKPRRGSTLCCTRRRQRLNRGLRSRRYLSWVWAARSTTVCAAPRRESARLARQSGQQILDLVVLLARDAAGILVAIVALAAVLVVAALELANLSLAPAYLAPALLVGFRLAGGGPVHGLGGDADRGGHHTDSGSRQAAGQGKHGHRSEQEGRALHPTTAATRALARQ
ncbi:hypothetical protein NOVOSPHI9U_50371 [Novosphingobium sp. 9U]|nr:hypothetical protein NOVOSPHI9U_50371 [Novosphingobium sp. 9U]